jgi:hypothetical protein
MIWQLHDYPIDDKMDQLIQDVDEGARPYPEPGRTLSCMLGLVSDCLIEAVGPERAAEMLEERWPAFIDEQREVIDRLRRGY